MPRTAHDLARLGRNGDTELLHVSKDELAALRGIGSLHGVTLTRNPHTGLPEAFNFKSLIPAAIGIAATVASGGTLTPLTAGLISGAATTAATGDIKQGVMAGMTGGATAGLAQGAMGMAGAGVSDAAAGSLGSGMAGVDTADTAGLAGTAMEGAAPAGLSTQAGSAAGANFGEVGSGFSGVGMEQGIGSLPQAQAPYAGATASSGPSMDKFMQNASSGQAWEQNFGGDKLMTRTAPGVMALANSVGSAMVPEMSGGASQEPSEFAKNEKHQKRDYRGPADPMYAINGGEPIMFSKPQYNFDNNGYAAGGGIAALKRPKESPEMEVVRKIRSRYRSKEAAIEDMQVPNSFMQRLGVTNPDHPIMQYAFGYTARQGRGKAQEPGMSPEPVPMMAEGGGVMSLGGRLKRSGATPEESTDWDRLEFSAAATEGEGDRMHVYGETINRKSGKIIDDRTMRTNKGTSEQRKAEEAARDLNKRPRIQMAQGGPIHGSGDGMSDNVPATIDGQRPARLSQGEFVVSADVVSHLGNGSTEAGFDQLRDMMNRIRAARTGRASQAPAIDPRKVMP